MGDDKPKKKKNSSGKTRKVASGAERINQYATAVSAKLKKSAERTAKWAAKEKQQANQERLKTIAHMLTEAVALLDTVAGKAATLTENGWAPPSPSVARAPQFNEGDRVKVRDDVLDYYSAMDQKALANMKIGKFIVTGKRTNYVIPGVGLVPKSHLELIAQ